jgi:hypothetical protein
MFDVVVEWWGWEEGEQAIDYADGMLNELNGQI